MQLFSIIKTSLMTENKGGDTPHIHQRCNLDGETSGDGPDGINAPAPRVHRYRTSGNPLLILMGHTHTHTHTHRLSSRLGDGFCLHHICFSLIHSYLLPDPRRVSMRVCFVLLRCATFFQVCYRSVASVISGFNMHPHVLFFSR